MILCCLRHNIFFEWKSFQIVVLNSKKKSQIDKLLFQKQTWVFAVKMFRKKAKKNTTKVSLKAIWSDIKRHINWKETFNNQVT